LKIAAISEAAKQAIKKAALDDNLTALLKIAKEKTPEAQVKSVDDLQTKKSRIGAKAAKRHAKVSPVVQSDPTNESKISEGDEKSLARIRREWKRAKKLRQEWKRASGEVQHRFAKEFLGLD
jgi:ABC-type branched-subunit amino acid transport system substrate-binding protein